MRELTDGNVLCGVGAVAAIVEVLCKMLENY